jgi:hypothetical protein
MALFRRRKNADRKDGNNLNYHDGDSNKRKNNSSRKEELLHGQVEDLQEEMKRLNKRLLSMQAKVQNTGTTAPSPVNLCAPAFSQRQGLRTEVSSDGASLLADEPSKHAFRRKKGMENVFVPHEIDFVSKGPVLSVANIFKKEQTPPVKEIDIRNRTAVESIDIIAVPQTDIKDISSSTNKAIASQYCKNTHVSSSKAHGDTESTTSSHQTTFTTKNRRNVKRIVRKVRAVPKNATTTAFVSRAPVMPKQIDETKSSLSPTKRSHQGGLSTTERQRGHFEIRLSDVFVDDSIDSSLGRKLSPQRKNQILNEDNTPTSSPKTEIFSSTYHNGKTHTVNSVLEQADRNTESEHVESRVVERIEFISSHPTGDQVDRQTNKISKSMAEAPKPKNLLADIRAGVKLNKVTKSKDAHKDSQKVGGLTATCSHSTANLVDDGTPISSQNQKNSLLEGIKAGVQLKQVDRSALQDQTKKETPMSALLAKIQERKQKCLCQVHPSVENSEQNEIDW